MYIMTNFIDIIIKKEINLYLFNRCYSCPQYNVMVEKENKLSYEEFDIVRKGIERYGK